MERYQELEQRLAEWTGMPHVVACSSGTAALHLALEALSLPLDSEVICPDFTMIACARAISLAGLTPMFVDCDDTLNMDPTLIRPGIYAGAKSRRTSAILAVHTYGRRCNMDAIHDGAEPRFLAVIEDMAELHGIKPHPLTETACWSFYKNKIVAGEEGGAVAFRDPKAAAHARQLRSLGFTDAHDFNHIPRGHNYRMSNCHADLILKCLDKFNDNVMFRRYNEGLYNRQCPVEWKQPFRDSPWVYDIRIPGLTTVQQNKIVKELASDGTRHAFKPMCDQQEYARSEMVAHDNICGTLSRKASKEVIYLPLDRTVTPEKVHQQFDTIWRILEEER